MKYLIIGAVSLLLIACVATGWQVRHWHLYSVQTASMQPAVKRGSLIVVRPTKHDLKVGSIGSYHHPLNPIMVVTHRVTGYDKHRHLYHFKGDRNAASDNPVPAQNIVGTVALALPYAGYVCNYLRTPLGLAIGVYLPAGGIITYEIYRLASAKKNYKLNT